MRMGGKEEEDDHDDEEEETSTASPLTVLVAPDVLEESPFGMERGGVPLWAIDGKRDDEPSPAGRARVRQGTGRDSPGTQRCEQAWWLV